jgi:hypothetical protein
VLSTAVSALPVVTLFFVLVRLKKRVWISALSGFLVAVALALFVFGMPRLWSARPRARRDLRPDADRLDRRRLDLSL